MNCSTSYWILQIRDHRVLTQHCLQYLSYLMSPVRYTCEKKEETNVACFMLYEWSFHLMIPFHDSQITLFQHSWILWLIYKQTVPAVRSWCKTEAPALHSSQGVSTPGSSPWLQPWLVILPDYMTYFSMSIGGKSYLLISCPMVQYVTMAPCSEIFI